ncbi:hypothetical protein BDA96_08G123700 [Sorghum bicolor]|uniref:Uncharacterized protein n=1 Tax=Sorghum bicolor TaxID=4558 RepID=A0A921U811_SORBI|nr:hypothetical protein BDA96_08G123700 [Sorghum bicolor]
MVVTVPSASGSSHKAPSLTPVHGGDGGIRPSAGGGSSPFAGSFSCLKPVLMPWNPYDDSTSQYSFIRIRSLRTTSMMWPI